MTSVSGSSSSAPPTHTLFKSNHDRVPRGLAPYGVAEWDRHRGNHRAVVRVEEAADAVCAYLPWRRRDAHPEAKHVMVVDARTQETVTNVVVVTCTREYGEIVFQPASGAGEYHLYYLVPEEDAYGETWPRSSFPIIRYKRPQHDPDPAWLRRHGLTRRDVESTPDPADWSRPDAAVYPAPWRELPLAERVEFQSRGARHLFYPMEVVATLDERFELEHRCRFQPFILFAERRERPIRMDDALPHVWAVRDEETRTTLTDTVLRNEYYVFQIGVYASRQLLHHLRVECSDLRAPSGERIGSAALTCFNLGGVDQYGNEFEKSVDVEKGKVQALWFGLDVSRDAVPGQYQGRVTVSADGLEPQSVTLELEVRDEVLEDRGDGDHWRLSRLRWLDSRIGLDDEVCAPFTPVQVQGATVEILGRRIQVAPSGMIGQVTSSIDMFEIREPGRAVLRGPVRLDVVQDGRPVEWRQQELTCRSVRPGKARYVSTASSQHLSLRVETTVEMDGFIGHQITVETDRPVSVDAVRVQIPFLGASSRYWMGPTAGASEEERGWPPHKMDFGQAPSAPRQVPAESFEVLWLGDYCAGLCLRLPPGEQGWINHGRGQVRVEGDGTEDARPEADGGNADVADARPAADGGTARAKDVHATADGGTGSVADAPAADDRGPVRPEDARAAITGKPVPRADAPPAATGGRTRQEDARAAITGKPVPRADAPPAATGWRTRQKDALRAADNGHGSPEDSELGGRLVTLDSGPQVLDGKCRFAFELYATPFKPLTPRQWSWRHYHQSYGKEPSLEQGQQAGATIFTYHQGNRTNPYISYPFLTAGRMKERADRIHAGGGLMKAYYTIRELSDRAVELWALRSLGAEILPGPGPDARAGYEDAHMGYEELCELPLEYQLRNPVSWPFTGYPWLCEHLVRGYHARWHTTVQMEDRVLIDASVQVSGASRWSNFYMEGLRWLMENAGLDGIYLDGITFDRESFKRVRKTLVRTKPEGLIDYHSHPTVIGQLPYFDRLWNGEGFDPQREAAYWLVAASGVPFGVSGELLQSHASVQRGMVFGLSQRYGWMPLDQVDPSALWRWWDEFDIAGSQMLGYWQEACPVRTDHESVKATAYVHRGERVAIAVASWAQDEVEVRIEVDWEAVGLDPAAVTVSAPAIGFFQEAMDPVSLDAVPVEPDSGWILVADRYSEG